MLNRFQAVTIDFHNTLMRCDEWFQLEVLDLVPTFLDWLETQEKIQSNSELRDQGRSIYRGLRGTVVESGVEIDAAECVRRTMAKLHVSVTAQEVDEGLEAIMRPHIADASPMAGAVGLVSAVHARGIPMAVVSSAVYHPYLEWTLEAHGIADSFNEIISSASVGLYKSTPLIYEMTAKTLNVEPSVCLHIGDSWRYDIDSAARAGFSTVLIGNGHQRETGYRQPSLRAGTLEHLHSTLFGVSEVAT